MTNEKEPRPTILVVDDYDEYRETVKMFLERCGYDVLEAEDGRQAVEIARETPPAVILMDLGLPDFGGVAAIRDIRQDTKIPTCPIIAVTAYDTPALHEEALAAGCDKVQTKPVDFDRLIALLESYGATAKRPES